MAADALKVAFYTLGCKVNQYDSSAVAALFRERGYVVVPFSEKADVYVVNTCTVTAAGDKKSRQALRRARRQDGSAIVVAMGCYSQTDSAEVERETGADLVFGTGDHSEIVDTVERLLSERREARAGLLNGQRLASMTDDCIEAGDSSRERVRVVPACEYTSFEDIPVCDALDRTRAFVKIQEGCDQYCTYCKVPYARGRSRSRDPQSVLTQVRNLVELGFREVVLIGIHLGFYGRDLSPATDLAAITSSVAEIEGVWRVRLGSVECTELTPELLEVIAGHHNVCRHLHVPLQSGADGVLRRMGRPYTADKYFEAISAARSRIPECAISADVMVGFPGESEAEFEQSMDFVRKCRFSRLHVFGYSRRSGTPAASAPGQIRRSVIEERVDRMSALGHQLSNLFHEGMIGRKFEVLVEGRDPADNTAFGHTDTYVWVSYPDPEQASQPNELVTVRITSVGPEGVCGVMKEKQVRARRSRYVPQGQTGKVS